MNYETYPVKQIPTLTGLALELTEAQVRGEVDRTVLLAHDDVTIRRLAKDWLALLKEVDALSLHCRSLEAKLNDEREQHGMVDDERVTILRGELNGARDTIATRDMTIADLEARLKAVREAVTLCDECPDHPGEERRDG